MIMPQTPYQLPGKPVSETRVSLSRVMTQLDVNPRTSPATFITDTGLESLKGLTELRTLRIAQTPVTSSGVTALQEASPKLKIQR